MAERYKVIAEQEYADVFFGGMPVALIKSRMLFDNDTQKVITQIKLMSITDSVIDTVYLSLKFYDVAGAVIAEINEHIMSMLDIQENKTFGDKFPAYISDTRAARVDVSIGKVVFKSGNVWENADDQHGVKVSPAAPVDIKPNLKEQFLKSTSGFNVRTNCRYEEFDNCKRCSCGFLNENEAVYCRSCRISFEEIKKCFSEDYLTENIYNDANRRMSSESINSLKIAVELFEKIPDYNDSSDKLQKCKTTLARLEAEEAERLRLEAERKEADRKAKAAAIAEENRRKKKRNTIIAVVSSLTVVCVATAIVLFSYVFPLMDYNAAMDLYNEGRYDEAAEAFENVNYKNSAEMVLESKYQAALTLFNNGNYDEAVDAFKNINYKNSADMVLECKYQGALMSLDNEDYNKAIELFSNLEQYKDSANQLRVSEELLNDYNLYMSALDLMDKKSYKEAENTFKEIKDYKDSAEKAEEALGLWKAQNYELGVGCLNSADYQKAYECLSNLDYKDSADLATEANYQYALTLYSKKDYDNSNKIFSELGNYKESASHIHTHKYVVTNTVDALCDKGGSISYKCSDCESKYTESTNALGHKYNKSSCTTDTYCLTCGYVKSKAQGHKMSGHKCTVCGYSDLLPLTQKNLEGTWVFYLDKGDRYGKYLIFSGDKYTEKSGGSSLTYTYKVDGNKIRVYKDGVNWLTMNNVEFP